MVSNVQQSELFCVIPPFCEVGSHNSYIYDTRMEKEMPDAGVPDNLIPVCINDSVKSTVMHWHMYDLGQEESDEGTAEMTESEESEETTAMPEDADDDNRIESNDLTRRSQGQSKHVEKKLEKW